MSARCIGSAWAPPAFEGEIGVARRDISPPAGIFARCWGPATHAQATGIHRPLTLTALAIRPLDGGDPFVLIAVDLGWWRRGSEERRLREAVRARFDLDEARVLVHLSHTHAGPSTCRDDVDEPGGDLVPPYLERLGAAAIEAAGEALAAAAPAVLEWGTGRCQLAATRDLPHDGRYLVGFNPDAAADDTVLVGRVSDGDGRIVATLVNYACHPTTLAWQNTLISPDWVGAMRETVERETGGAPCLFLQGASGELAPREQYVGDVGVPDRHGRGVGHAALSVLATMPPPGTELVFAEVVESGAPLAVWRPQRRQAPTAAAAARIDVPVDLKELPSLEELDTRWAGIDPNSRAERLRRARRLREDYEGERGSGHPVWIWRLGDCAFVAHPGEAYSALQRELRARHPDVAIAVMNITNGPGFMYLPPRDAYQEDIYPVWQTLLAAGSLERVIEAADEGLTAGAAAAGGAPRG